MREPVDEAFREWEARQIEYERKCPVCKVCGMHIYTDHMYEIDGETICDDIDCIRGYLEPFRANTDTWIENQEV